MTATPVSIKLAHEVDGLQYVYFYVAIITEPGDEPEALSAKISIIQNMQRSQHPDVAANLSLARLNDISPTASTKLHLLPPGTKREEAAGWIETPEGRSWAKGTVGGSLCQIVLSIPK